MNQIKTILVDDPFRAAYLLRFGKYRGTKIKDGKQCYLIEGEAQTLSEEDYRYRTGYARVNPLSLKESFYLLKELSEDNELPEEEEIDLLANDDDEEIEQIDLLADEEE